MQESQVSVEEDSGPGPAGPDSVAMNEEENEDSQDVLLPLAEKDTLLLLDRTPKMPLLPEDVDGLKPYVTKGLPFHPAGLSRPQLVNPKSGEMRELDPLLTWNTDYGEDPRSISGKSGYVWGFKVVNDASDPHPATTVAYRFEDVFTKRVHGECVVEGDRVSVGDIRMLEIYDPRRNESQKRHYLATKKVAVCRVYNGTALNGWYGMAFIYEIERAPGCYIYWAGDWLVDMLGLPKRWISDAWDTIEKYLENLELPESHMQRGWQQGNPGGGKKPREDARKEVVVVHTIEQQQLAKMKAYSHVAVMLHLCAAHLVVSDPSHNWGGPIYL